MKGRDKLVNFHYVKEATSLSRTRIWQLEKEGKFPQGTRYSKRCCRWRESEVQAWIAGEWEGE
jgi:prophage regulatory protein